MTRRIPWPQGTTPQHSGLLLVAVVAIMPDPLAPPLALPGGFPPHTRRLVHLLPGRGGAARGAPAMSDRLAARPCESCGVAGRRDHVIPSLEKRGI